MSLPTISPAGAKRLLEQGGVLVDVREADEHAREKIAEAQSAPLSRLDQVELPLESGRPVIFHCKSGARTQNAAHRLQAKVGSACDAYIVEGGIESWKKAGLPVSVDRGQPLEMQRQVQIVAGAVGSVGTLLAAFWSPWFMLVPGFVGAGLLFAGLTGFCGMARVLMKAPWNRTRYASSARTPGP